LVVCSGNNSVLTGLFSRVLILSVIRRAARLRIRQLNRLRMSIFDADALDRAIASLDTLYATYIADATGTEGPGN
jgi:hypothetical protein